MRSVCLRVAKAWCSKHALFLQTRKDAPYCDAPQRSGLTPRMRFGSTRSEGLIEGAAFRELHTACFVCPSGVALWAVLA